MSQIIKFDPEATVGTSGAVERCLSDFGYRFDNPKTGDYRFFIATEDGNRWRAQIIGSAEAVLQFFVFLTDEGFPPEKTPEIRAVIEGLNNIVVFGGFAFKSEYSLVIFKDAEQLSGEPTPDDIARLLNRSAVPLALFRTGFNMVRDGFCDGEAAVKYSKLLHGCSDDEQEMTDETRRKLWTAVDGLGISESPPNPTPLLSLV